MQEMRKTQKTLGILLYKLGKTTMRHGATDGSGVDAPLSGGAARMFAQTNFADDDGDDSLETPSSPSSNTRL